ncbi:MAG: hypothetical protein ACFFG0_45830 [Candidatus Thorarchaeota archaeon]
MIINRIDKLQFIIDEYREVLNEKILKKFGKLFYIIAPTRFLNPEDFLKSDIA